MSDLPNRKSFKHPGITLDDVLPILASYVLGELMTAQEWRAAEAIVAAEAALRITDAAGGSDEK